MSIEAMKQALEALAWVEPCDSTQAMENAIDALCQAIEQAERQEPVAHDKTELNRFAQDLYDQKMREGKHGHYESMFHVIHQCIKRVAPPPRQPLTDEQIEKLWEEESSCDMPDNLAQFRHTIRVSEAAHGIKE